MKPIRTGVIGLGMVAQIMHLPYLKELDEFEIAAVCDASPELTKKIARHYGVPNAFTDYKKLIESDLDAVLVLTFHHCEIVKAAAAAGKHVFCEKPAAFSLHEFDEMARAVERAGVPFMIGYMKRYDESYRLGQRLFGKMSAAGDVRLIRVHDACFQNDLAIRSMYKLWKYDDLPPSVVRDGNRQIQRRVEQALGKAPANVRNAYRLLLETGSHDVNALRGAFGDPARVVSTEIWPNGNWLSSVLDYGGEVRCLLDVARTARNWGDEELTAFGMTGTVSVLFPNPFHKNAPTTVETIAMKGDSTTRSVTKASHSEAFRNELKHFAQCIARREQPLTSLNDGFKDTKLMIDMIRKYGK
ncbi:MAG: Gfo/Idh/MocA family oxidoreductase [bacterium]